MVSAVHLDGPFFPNGYSLVCRLGSISACSCPDFAILGQVLDILLGHAKEFEDDLPARLVYHIRFTSHELNPQSVVIPESGRPQQIVP